jgi:hypothetical protein
VKWASPLRPSTTAKQAAPSGEVNRTNGEAEGCSTVNPVSPEPVLEPESKSTGIEPERARAPIAELRAALGNRQGITPFDTKSRNTKPEGEAAHRRTGDLPPEELERRRACQLKEIERLLARSKGTP